MRVVGYCGGWGGAWAWPLDLMVRYRKEDEAPVSVTELVGRPEAKTKKKKSKTQEAMDKVKGMIPRQGRKEEAGEI